MLVTRKRSQIIYRKAVSYFDKERGSTKNAGSKDVFAESSDGEKIPKSKKAKKESRSRLESYHTKQVDNSKESEISDSSDESQGGKNSSVISSKKNKKEKVNIKDGDENDSSIVHQLMIDESVKNRSQDGENETINNTNRFSQTSKFKYGDLKLEDSHLKNLLNLLSQNRIFAGSIDFSGQSLTDQSLLKLSNILRNPFPQIIELNLKGCTKFGTQGVCQLAESLNENQVIRTLNLGDIC